MCAGTGSPTGPVTVTGMSCPWVAAARVAAEPSPPSTSGRLRTTAAGTTRRTPAVMASATSSADRLSVNPLGATTKRRSVVAMTYL